MIIFSLICSLLVSLSLVPMLASRLLQAAPGSEQKDPSEDVGRIAAASKGFFDNITTAYKNLLCWVLDHRLITITAAVIVLGASLFLLPEIGTEFLPPQ